MAGPPFCAGSAHATSTLVRDPGLGVTVGAAGVADCSSTSVTVTFTATSPVPRLPSSALTATA